MAIGWNAEMPVGERMPTTRLRAYAARLLSWLFGRKGVDESVATRVRFDRSPEEVWNHIMFYEEVPGRPAFLLRTMLPYPVRTEGDKTRVGATVRCAYREGIWPSASPRLNRRICCNSKSSSSVWGSRAASSRVAVRTKS